MISEGGLINQGATQIAVTSDRKVIVAGVGSLIEVDIASGAQHVLTTGKHLSRPIGGIAVSSRGTIFAGLSTLNDEVNPALIVEVDLSTGDQSLRAEFMDYGRLTDLDVDQSGQVFAAMAFDFDGSEQGHVLSINPDTGHVKVVTEGGLVTTPIGLALGVDGQVYTAEALTRAVIRWNPQTDQQQILSIAGLLSSITDMTGDDSGLYVAANNRLLRIDPVTGAQQIVAEGFRSLGGIAIVPVPAPGACCAVPVALLVATRRRRSHV